jgi:hypothetical protein
MRFRVFCRMPLLLSIWEKREHTEEFVDNFWCQLDITKVSDRFLTYQLHCCLGFFSFALGAAFFSWLLTVFEIQLFVFSLLGVLLSSLIELVSGFS